MVNDPWPLAAACGVDSMLHPVIKKNLHSDADSQDRPTPGQPKIVDWESLVDALPGELQPGHAFHDAEYNIYPLPIPPIDPGPWSQPSADPWRAEPVAPAPIIEPAPEPAAELVPDPVAPPEVPAEPEAPAPVVTSPGEAKAD